jgi:hypothetical protein
MSSLLIAYHNGSITEAQMDARISATVGAEAHRIATLEHMRAYLLEVVVEMDAPGVADRLSAPDLRVYQSRPLLPVGHVRRPPRKLGPNDPPGLTPPPGRPSSVAIAVLDADGFYQHEVFQGRLKLFDATGAVVEEDRPGCPVPRPKLGQSEGTAVASVAAGAAPCAGPASRSTVWGFLTKETGHMVAAMNYIVDKNLTAASEERPPVRVAVTAWKVQLEAGENATQVGFVEALARLEQAGIIFVAAAGNTGLLGEEMAPPAVLPNVIAVGGYEDVRPTGPGVGDGVHADSTRGPVGEHKPETLAPYENWIVAPELPELVVHAGRGTSLAAGYVAGVLATLVDLNEGLTRGKVKQLLQIPGVSENLGAQPHEQGFGALRVDVARAQVGVV